MSNEDYEKAFFFDETLKVLGYLQMSAYVYSFLGGKLVIFSFSHRI